MIRRIEFRMTGQCLRNDMLAVSGQVARKYRADDGTGLIDVELNIATQDAPSVPRPR